MNAVWTSAVAVLVGFTCLWCATDGLQAVTTEGARRIAATRANTVVPDISLETMTGETVRLKSEDGSVLVVEFIYTSCPTICRTAGLQLARLRDQLSAGGLTNKVRIFSVSIDPAHDDVGALAAYGSAHGADGATWTVARPSQEDLPRLLKTFGVVVIPDGFGGFEHNAALHVVNGEGRLTAIVDIDDIHNGEREVRQALR